MKQLLDHGYLELIETWGSDERIIEAARMSTDKGFLGWGPFKCKHCDGSGVQFGEGEMGLQRLTCERCHGSGKIPGDEKLLRYLYAHNHSTPFEMAGMTIEVQAPIFVFREWHRHRTQSYNELSARYTPLPDVNYVPTIERLLMTSSSNKQAQSAGGYALDEQQAELWLASLQESYERSQSTYACGLDWGVPKELARLPVPVGRYSRMRASANLRNWFLFLTLRMAPNAQWEIRQYADAVCEVVVEKFPRTAQLFLEDTR